jgi:Rieske Fe-S protein
MDVSRRRFCKISGSSITVIATAAALGVRCAGEETNPDSNTNPNGNNNDPGGQNNDGITLDLTKEPLTELQSPGSALKVEIEGISLPLIVIHNDDGTITALSSECTHLGCEVNAPSGEKIVCPCHNSQFDLSGEVLGGPAPAPLARYPAEMSGDKKTITIDTA